MTQYLFIASDYKPNTGGIAAYVDTLARGLITNGHRVNVLAVVGPHDTARIAFLKAYEPWVSPFIVAPDERPNNRLGNMAVSALEILRCLSPRLRRLLEMTSVFAASSNAVSRLAEILSFQKPSMVVFGHLDLRLYSLVLLLTERHVPYGIIAHDWEVIRHPAKPNDIVRRGVMLKRAAMIIANSQHTSTILEQWNIDKERVAIVHPPISEEALRASVGFEPATRNSVFTLVTVCRLVRSKGVDIVLRALRILNGRQIPFRYLVIGDGPERQYLEDLAVELQLSTHVTFLGYIADHEKWQLLRSADVFVMTSRVNIRMPHEGFGIAFTEAGACGVAVVGSMAGGIPDAVVDGETGMLVEPESPDALAAALTFLHEHEDIRRQMGQAGQRRATKEFLPEAVASHFDAEVSRRLSSATMVAK